ncbi:DUF2637 domain-containing protein [Micromonospora tarensis]|uniref:DUF2637 domain-containing protein n=1 Tax=Micromonospora tarensis TaxID=2806100 RepID=A0ABS1YCD5_9ACTN|nr:DUF2637 domain-containing protein [Micromonospora tarensis]MBM0275077.1 DUF2637 domain-containing protein [Micromonospora tarensis]
MTAPAVNGTKYPPAVDALLPQARALVDELGEVPSRNRLMREYKIGAPKADELRDLLMTPPTEPAADVEEEPIDPWDNAQPIDPEPAPTPAGSDEPGSVTEDADPPTADPEDEDRPRRRWFRRRKSAEASPQVPTPGHPGKPAAVAPAPAGTAERKSLVRIRWGVRLVLTLGVAASIAGNVLHAQDRLISQVISAWSPLALLLTIELISRVPVHSRRLAVGRWAATALIAGIAAWVSYWHMAAVASRYGETNGSQYLLPLSVDGLVVVASICLVELGGRIATATKHDK